MIKIEKLFIPLPNGDIEINKVELHRHKFLKAVVAKEKKKDQVDKMMYIYLMHDIGSMYNHLSGEEKEIAVRNHLGFDDVWSPTPEMVLAANSYKELMEVSATGRAYLSASKAVYETGKDLDRTIDMISLLKHSLETRINKVKNDTHFTESEKMENIKEARAFILEIATTQKALIDNIKTLPNLLKTVKDLGTSFAEEGGLTTRVHGGGEIGNRE